MRWRLGLALAVAPSLALGIAAALVVSSAPAETPVLPAGCDADRSAVAYHADGSIVATPAAPVACGGTTGFGATEGHIRVGPSGDVVHIPARVPTGLPMVMEAGLGVSTDNGSSWHLVEPDGQTFQPNDNSIHVDRVTGRLYVALVTEAGESLAGEVELFSSPASPEGYVDWTSQIMHGHVGSENPRFTTAPAPNGAPQPTSGGRMAYWCGNNAPLVTIVARICYRSFDGGASWELASILFNAEVPQHSECGSEGEEFSPLDGNYPQGASDGSLWVMVECGGTTYLARSTDEAASFPIVRGSDDAPLRIPFSSPSGHRELRVDADGTLYAAEESDGALLLRLSRDGGHTWSVGLDMTLPSTRSATTHQWQVAVGDPGEVAVTYLKARSGGGFDAYISVTYDALGTDPVFYGSMINAPTAPMSSVSNIGNDFVDVDLAPDGTPWAIFYSDCVDSDAFCAAAVTEPVPEGHVLSGPQATTIGRLVWPLPEPGVLLSLASGAALLAMLARHRALR